MWNAHYTDCTAQAVHSQCSVHPVVEPHLRLSTKLQWRSLTSDRKCIIILAGSCENTERGMLAFSVFNSTRAPHSQTITIIIFPSTLGGTCFEILIILFARYYYLIHAFKDGYQWTVYKLWHFLIFAKIIIRENINTPLTALFSPKACTISGLCLFLDENITVFTFLMS